MDTPHAGANPINYDFVIVGAGIIGLTTALELKKRFPGSTVGLFEKESHLGAHASGRNSGVLHSGIYYSSNTLKAKLCATGASKMRQFAQEHQIACKRSGKVIIATSEQDLPVVEKLLTNAKENHINAVELDEKGVREHEPYAGPFRKGIFCQDTSVIDIHGVLEKLQEILQANGVEIHFDQAVIKIKPQEKRIYTSSRNYGYGYLFNCAGAYADMIAKRFGLAGDYTLLPFKGLYYKLRPGKNHLVRNNIYPVPNLFLPFLGVHLTRLIGEDVYVGPTSIPAFGRENYGILSGIRPLESVGILWQLAGMYVKNEHHFRMMVHTEVKKYLKSNFFRSAQRLVPDLVIDDLIPSSKVGIRPQLVNIRTRSLEMDYVIQQTPDSTHVLNSISPAFTCSFVFAELLVDRMSQKA